MKSNSSSKDIEKLKLELQKMHQQFDSIDIEKYKKINANIDLNSEELKLNDSKPKLNINAAMLANLEKNIDAKNVVKEVENKNESESYLSIKEELKKIKLEIKEKEKKYNIPPLKNKLESKENIQQTEKNIILEEEVKIISENTEKSKLLTIILLTLILVLLTSIYFIFLK